MATSEEGFIDRLINEEIRRIVAEAVADGGILSAQKCAAQILRAYRGSALSKTELADRIMMAAASAGVAVEIGRRKKIRGKTARTAALG
jgi:hypothetical protein